MLDFQYNVRNKQDAVWRQFISLLEYKANRYGCQAKQVEPERTAKACASCDVEKKLWVRQRRCSDKD